MSHNLSRVEAVVLDLDGTLVDSVYQHVITWQAAFREVGKVVDAATLHRHIGMGGDRLVTEVAGEATEHAVGDQVRSLHDRHFEEALHEIQELDGTSDLLNELGRRGFQMVVVTSGKEAVARQLLAVVEARAQIRSLVSGSEVETSKPAPDLIDRALHEAGVTRPVAVGDAVWDAEAAAQRGIDCIGLLSGGISAAELEKAGAGWVYANPRDLLQHLDETPLATRTP